MRALVFEVGIWDEYEKLRHKDKGTHDKLCRIIKQLLRNPVAGAGKPKQLKHDLTDMWARRIDRKNRIVYRYDENCIYIHGVAGHYNRI